MHVLQFHKRPCVLVAVSLATLRAYGTASRTALRACDIVSLANFLACGTVSLSILHAYATVSQVTLSACGSFTRHYLHTALFHKRLRAYCTISFCLSRYNIHYRLCAKLFLYPLNILSFDLSSFVISPLDFPRDFDASVSVSSKYFCQKQ
jgi:hypothetical protein